MYTQDQVTLGGRTVARIFTTLPDGTRSAAVRPENWNGTLLVDLDGADCCRPDAPMAAFQAPRLAAYFAKGYAYGGINRDAVGYRFPDAVQMLVDLKDAFANAFGAPEYTIAIGGSRGAFVGRMCMELRPDVFAGALVYGGGGSGEIAALNAKLDGKWTLNALLEPDEPLILANVPDLAAEERKLGAIFDRACATPLGRARLALAAAFEQLPAWADPNAPEPAADDWAEQFRQLCTCFQFAQFNFGTYTIEQLAGGAISWNTGIDYAELLERSGRKDFILGMYSLAGVGAEGLEADLKRLAAAPRVQADPAAVSRAEKYLTYKGELRGPVVNLDNIGDQVDPESCKYAYRDTLRKKGSADLLRVLWVHSSGHCNFTNAEMLEALEVLMRRVKQGAWGDLSPARLNGEAAALDLPVLPGVRPGPSPRPETAAEAEQNARAARFFEYVPAPALRAWDFENWDTYSVE